MVESISCRCSAPAGSLGSRGAAYYRPPRSRAERDAPVIAALNAVVERHPKHGLWKCVDRLRAMGHGWNWKRIHRVYRALGLNLPRRTKRRIPKRLRQPLDAPAVLNGTWALDFMTDSLYAGRAFRTLNIIDEGNREALAIEIAHSIPSTRTTTPSGPTTASAGCRRSRFCRGLRRPWSVLSTCQLDGEAYGPTQSRQRPGEVECQRHPLMSTKTPMALCSLGLVLKSERAGLDAPRPHGGAPGIGRRRLQNASQAEPKRLLNYQPGTHLAVLSARLQGTGWFRWRPTDCQVSGWPKWGVP
jgi:hypothetical protein